ncbi:MAG: type II toxin-antitoxin system RelE/ParE family toxin [Chitinophagaceae bacterium]|nr:type II toxin-antitoxin system RelE/ParE family toxin [Chitinophagaceae bacterium]
MRKYKLVVEPEVRHDIREARLWYKDKSVSLSGRFAKEVKTVIEQLRKQPFSHSIRYLNMRIANLKIFPYAIHYYVEENTITLVAVFHTAIDPEKWLSRK